MSSAIETQRGEWAHLGPGDAIIDEAYARSVLPSRAYGAHKWGVGGLVIVAGSPGFVGAPALCAMAAGRAGAGIVSLAVPRGIAGAIAANVPEAAFVLLPESDSGGGGRKAVELIKAKLDRSTALLVGPGLGDDETSTALLAALFGIGGSRAVGFRGAIGFATNATREEPEAEAPPPVGIAKPVVIDADGLNWLAKQDGWRDRFPARQAVLTPHVGEMARLLGKEPNDIVADPVGTAREASRSWDQVVVFKYGHTVVSDGDRTLIAEDAPPSLASAGTGDVLAGTIGAFLAQGLAPVDAAALAVFVGGRAARRVERRFGTLGLVASDLPPAIAEELAALERAPSDSAGAGRG